MITLSAILHLRWIFSDNREVLAGEKHKKRFFAGVPNIPPKKPEKMAIYLLFLQHIIFSLGEHGKAAVVVPTGFLTSKSGIEKKIKEHIVSNRMLKGVISMPSNIFATTGTNVSIIFFDKDNINGKITLMDASKLGTKVKMDDNNQRTVLSNEEIEKIINIFIAGESVDDFCISVDYEDIESKKLSFSAGQYFEVKIEYVDITAEEFETKMEEYKSSLNKKFQKGHDLEANILEQIGGLKYE